MTLEPSAWTRLRATLDPYTRRYLGMYSAYSLTSEEFIDSIYLPLGGYDLRDYLTKNGYEPARLSAAKRHPGSDRLHVLSMRRRPETHPFAVAGTALEGVDPRRCQFHLHAFNTDVSGFVDCFIHYERAPDLRRLGGESWGDVVTRLKAHYRPQYDCEDVNREEWNYLRGVKDPELDLKN